MSSQKSDADAQIKKPILPIQQTKVSSNPIKSELVQVRCPLVKIHKKTGKKIRCNARNLDVWFGRGEVLCRDCGGKFYFEINTTTLSSVKTENIAIAEELVDVLR